MIWTTKHRRVPLTSAPRTRKITSQTHMDATSNMANSDNSVGNNNIAIRRGDPSSPASTHYINALTAYLETLPGFAHLQGPKMGGPDSPRPHNLPPGSIMLYATTHAARQEARPEEDDDDHGIGSLCIMPLYPTMPQFRNLPATVTKAAEIKRMIVFPGHRGKGVASRLIAEAERVACEEMGATYMVVETLWLLDGAQALYRAAGYQGRDVWGGYVKEDSVCFEKWL